MKKKATGIHLFFSIIENESRLMKLTNSLISLNILDEILIIGKASPDLKTSEEIDDKRSIFRVPLTSKKSNNPIFRKFIALFRILKYHVAALFTVIKKKPTYISCHNLILLPLGVVAKLFTGAKLIYVPHELETERTGVIGINKKLSKLNESFFVKYVNNIMVVCEPIAKWYEDEYKISKVFVLPNIPINPYINSTLEKKSFFREQFKIAATDLIFIYQGVIDEARGCRDLIECFKMLPKNKHLVLMGYGELEEFCIDASKNIENIHFKKAVETNQIIDYTSSADVGIFFLPFEIGKSYVFSLPNKFFEYLIAGLPIFVSDNLHYISNIIANDNLGWVCKSNNQAFIEKINQIDFDQILCKTQSINEYSKKIGWQNEEKILFEVYN